MRLTVPALGAEEFDEVKAVLQSGYLTQGPKATEFEGLVAGFVGSRRGLATSSCTTALHLSLVALGIGPGDEVVVPDFTFPATANVVVELGAVPILVDINPSTFTLDPQELDRVVTRRTRAIMPVHAFGLCADMDAVMAFARPRGIPVVEDAACALGAEISGLKAGALGDVACFSFHPRKVITTGEGGMVTTNDEALGDRLRLLSSHGACRGDLYLSFEEAGFNYRMSDVNAAIGVIQMGRLDWILNRRRALASRYQHALASSPGIAVPVEPDGYRHSFQSYVVTLADGIDRDAVIRATRQAGVETTLGTYAVHAQPFFQRKYGYRQGDLKGSDGAFRQSLTIPLYPSMTEADVDVVVDSLTNAVAAQG